MSYQCSKSQCGDELLISSSCSPNGNSYAVKIISLYWLCICLDIILATNKWQAMINYHPNKYLRYSSTSCIVHAVCCMMWFGTRQVYPYPKVYTIHFIGTHAFHWHSCLRTVPQIRQIWSYSNNLCLLNMLCYRASPTSTIVLYLPS